MEHGSSRRDMLRLGTSAVVFASGAVIVTGGAVATSAAGGAETIDRSAWDAEIANLKREQVRDAEINTRHQHAQANGTLTASLEQEWSESVEPVCAAEWIVFGTPAPDIRALHWKLTMLSQNGLPFEDDTAATILADVARLSGGKA